MNSPTEPLRSHPAPTTEDLKSTADDYLEGPNVEYSPTEVKAARGEVPLEGPRSHDALDFDEFRRRYADWKAATERFESAVRQMQEGQAGARETAQQAAVELARLHHAFMESSQPYFKAERAD